MNPDGFDAESLQSCVTRYADGDDTALNELMSRAMHRLESLTRTMFRDFSRVHRWEETADVVQGASIRLYRALQQTRPTDLRGFLALATLQIRRELTDLARKYFGPEGLGTNFESSGFGRTGADSSPHFDVTASSSSFDPQRLTDWTEFHRQAEQLPPEEREVFDLTYYQSLPQSEVAKVLNISERTVQRRWQSAREALQHFLNDQFPKDR